MTLRPFIIRACWQARSGLTVRGLFIGIFVGQQARALDPIHDLYGVAENAYYERFDRFVENQDGSRVTGPTGGWLANSGHLGGDVDMSAVLLSRGVVISDQYLLAAVHPGGSIANGEIFRLYRADGTYVERRVTQANVYSAGDLLLQRFDSPLTADDGIEPMPLLSLIEKRSDYGRLSVLQFGGSEARAIRARISAGTGGTFSYNLAAGAEGPDLGKAVGGDSGLPITALVGGQLGLLGTHSTTTTGNAAFNSIDQITGAIIADQQSLHGPGATRPSALPLVLKRTVTGSEIYRTRLITNTELFGNNWTAGSAAFNGTAAQWDGGAPGDLQRLLFANNSGNPISATFGASGQRSGTAESRGSRFGYLFIGGSNSAGIFSNASVTFTVDNGHLLPLRRMVVASRGILNVKNGSMISPEWDLTIADGGAVSVDGAGIRSRTPGVSVFVARGRLDLGAGALIDNRPGAAESGPDGRYLLVSALADVPLANTFNSREINLNGGSILGSKAILIEDRFTQVNVNEGGLLQFRDSLTLGNGRTTSEMDSTGATLTLNDGGRVETTDTGTFEVRRNGRLVLAGGTLASAVNVAAGGHVEIKPGKAHHGGDFSAAGTVLIGDSSDGATLGGKLGFPARSAVLTGSGLVDAGQQGLRVDGRVIADGGGGNRTLELRAQDARTVSPASLDGVFFNEIDNAPNETAGFYATNGGRLVYPAVGHGGLVVNGIDINRVNRDGAAAYGAFNLGETQFTSAAPDTTHDSSIDLVNSCRVDFSGLGTGDGVLTGALLDPSRPDAIVGPGSEIISVLDLTLAENSFDTTRLTIRYDHVKAGSRKDQLRMFQLRGRTWSELPVTRDTANHRISTANLTALGMFALGYQMVSAPLAFTDWQSFHGLAGEDPANDADHDGLCDLAEYALGGMPREAADHPAPVLDTATGKFGFRRLASRVSAECVVEISNDLYAWNKIATIPASGTATLADGYSLESNGATPETLWISPAAPPSTGRPWFIRLTVRLIPQ